MEDDGDVGHEFCAVLQEGYEMASEWISKVADTTPLKIRALPDEENEETVETAATKLWDLLAESEGSKPAEQNGETAIMDSIGN